MFYPKLAAGRQQTLTTEAFGGYDHNLELADGEFYDMENLSADDYPLLAPRPRRGTAQAIEGVQGILAKDALCWVRVDLGGGKAAHLHGRVSVHFPGWDLLQHREVFRQWVHGAGECGRRIEHERGNFSLPRRRDGADGEL